MSREMLPSSSEDSIATRAFGIIRRRAAVAAVAFFAVLAGAVAFALYLPDLYTASANVVIERPLAESVVRPAVSNDLESRLYVIKSEILSRDRLTELVKRFNLYPELRKKASFEEVLTQARDDIDWKPNGPEQVSGRMKTVSFTLSYIGDDPKTVADVTNAVAAFYVAHNSEMRASEARQTVQVLEQQMQSAREDADRQYARLSAFTSQNQSQLPQAAGVSAVTLSRLNDDIRRNQDEQRRLAVDRERALDLAAEAAEVTALATPNAAPGEELVPPSKELNALNDSLANAKKTLAEHERLGRTDIHPDVASAKKQIAALEKELTDQRARDVAAFRAKREADEQRRAASATGSPTDIRAALPRGRRAIADIDQEIERLKREESELRAQMAGMAAKIDSAPAVQGEYLNIQRDYLSAKEAYDVAYRKFEEARLAESIETSHQGENFRILDAAIVPDGPSAPNRLRLLIMGLLLAFAAMGAAVVAAEQLDTSFHSVDEIREFTSIPVLATIPQIGAAPRRGYLRLALRTASAVAAIVLIGSLSAYYASGNDTLVRLLQRAG